jgi:hypothetical protein
MVVSIYFYDRKLWCFASGWKLLVKQYSSLGDLSVLVKEDGYKGVFNRKVQSLAEAIKRF